jgi:heptosyltransferase-2
VTAAAGTIDRLLVVAPNWLGDAVMALPALGDLRRSLAGVRLIVAARPAVAPLFALAPAVDEVVTLAWRGRATAFRARRRDVARLRALAADAALLLPNSFASAWLVRRAGVAQRWGYRTDLRGALLSRAIARPDHSVHQADYYRRLARAVGARQASTAPAGTSSAGAALAGTASAGTALTGTASEDAASLLRVPDPAVEEARGRLRALGWDGARPLVVLAPGAAYGGAKRWPPPHFATLAARLIAERDATCVLVGTRDDAATTAWVRALVPAAARGHVLDLAGTTTLVELAAVLRVARACVSNDSGAMHLAGALGVPLAALFGPTRERETAPLGPDGRRTEVLVHHVWCRPCMLRECPLDHRCLDGLAPDRVLGRVTALLQGGAS